MQITSFDVIAEVLQQTSCADPERFVRRGPTLTRFLVDEGGGDPNTTISGPTSARQRNAI